MIDMGDYTITDARGKILSRIHETYDQKFLEQCRAGVQQRMKERGCKDIGELLEKINEDNFQEEVRKRQRLKNLGLLYPRE